jgi:hypothetical protein
VTKVRIDASVRSRIVDETRGNPLALHELGAGVGVAEFTGDYDAGHDQYLSAHPGRVT